MPVVTTIDFSKSIVDGTKIAIPANGKDHTVSVEAPGMTAGTVSLFAKMGGNNTLQPLFEADGTTPAVFDFATVTTTYARIYDASIKEVHFVLANLAGADSFLGIVDTADD